MIAAVGKSQRYGKSIPRDQNVSITLKKDQDGASGLLGHRTIS